MGQGFIVATPVQPQGEFEAIQPTFLQHADGRLQVLCRAEQRGIVTSFSTNEGKSWSTIEATGLPNPNSGIDVVTLADGRHLLVYNHVSSEESTGGKCGLLNLASSDDGLNWRSAGVLEQEPGGEFSYQAVVQTGDGLVHATYTWKRKRIKHVVLDPARLTVGVQLDNSATFLGK